ncbi:uracil-DNA glycosylase family protein [Azospirillum sp. TSO22-1]|uniref:uracil-DNA glycosylase family protein n=1 Tax=Azospirillum sp. TSO22-1 TaxID=716789 RepID=UPI00269AC1AC
MPSEGSIGARILVVGLAPALKGGNRTGLPFRGDASGRWLRAALERHGLGEDVVRITNAVRCVPPANRPTAAEVAACRPFLVDELSSPDLRAVVALGRVAHDAVLAASDLRGFAFGHGAVHALGRLTLVDSYHPSPQNTNTGRLTPAMFDTVFETAARILIELDQAIVDIQRKPYIQAVDSRRN